MLGLGIGIPFQRTAIAEAISPSIDTILTESGEYIITESGEYIILE